MFDGIRRLIRGRPCEEQGPIRRSQIDRTAAYGSRLFGRDDMPEIAGSSPKAWPCTLVVHRINGMHMRICFFGDSIVNGTGDPDCLGWVGRVCAAARQKRRRCHRLQSGHSARHQRGYSRALAPVRRTLACRPRWRAAWCSRSASTTASSKTALRRVQPAQTVANARAILAAAVAYAPTAHDRRRRRLAETDVNARVQELDRRHLRAACHELGVPFLDVFDRLAGIVDVACARSTQGRRRASRPGWPTKSSRRW